MKINEMQNAEVVIFTSETKIEKNGRN